MLSDGQSLTLVAAMGRNREIGYKGGMPWHLPRDLKHFKAITQGHAVIMGRKTWESLPFPLPGRLNLVVTRQTDYRVRGASVVNTLDMACQQAAEQGARDELMIIGGAQLYTDCLPLATIMQLSLIDISPQADTWFPEWNAPEWLQYSEDTYPADENNPYAVTFVEMRRKLMA